MKVLIHHTMEPNMDHAVYIGMSKPIRKTHAFLVEDSTMAEEIDRVIVEGVRSRLPVFIYVPTDVVSVQLDASRLETPLSTAVQTHGSEGEIAQIVLELIKSSSKPVILADVLTIRHGGQALTRELVDLTNFQSFSTPLSKGVINASHPNYGGQYNGTGPKLHILQRSIY